MGNILSSPVVVVGLYSVYPGEILGQGAFGTVYRAVKNDWARKQFAVKVITNPVAAAQEVENARKLSLVKHKNIVNILENHQIYGYPFIVMEYCEFGDLDDYFNNVNEPIDFVKKVNFMMQITQGLAFLHKSNIIHRDLKPNNVLIAKDNENPSKKVAKLSDFGLSKFCGPNQLVEIYGGYEWFKGPEYFLHKAGYYTQVLYGSEDVFSLGLTMLAMLQFKRGQKLKPVVENNPTNVEKTLPIGDVMVWRWGQGLDTNVLVDNEIHTEYGKQIQKMKLLISRAISFSPVDRPGAQDVYDALSNIAFHATSVKHQIFAST